MTQPTNQVTAKSIDGPEFRELLRCFKMGECYYKEADKALILCINAFVAKAEQDAYNIARAEFDLYHKKRVAEVMKAQMEKDAKIARDYCLVPPDGGSPNVLEVEYCAEIEAAIRSQK